MLNLRQLVAMSDAELRTIDPLVMNLAVASGIPALARLNIGRYQLLVDSWANAISRRLPQDEVVFSRTPWDWKNDVNFFRLGVMCWYVDEVLVVRYRENQRAVTSIDYTDPADLFLNGVLETRRGTCGNMAALHLALGWRLGWPVSLACAGYHYLLRYDDGKVTYNIEATNNGRGGFSSPPDESYQEYAHSNSGLYLPVRLKALTPREVLGAFVGLRARHYSDVGWFDEAQAHYRLAYRLCPASSLLEAKATRGLDGASQCVTAWSGVVVTPWQSLDITKSFIDEACCVEEVWS